MLKAVINAGILKDVVEAVSILVDEGRFHISRGELSLRAVDAANVAMVSLSLSSKAFDKYEAKDTEVGVDIKKLSDILSLVDSSKQVKLEVDTQTKKMIINVENLSCDISLLELAHVKKEPSVPSLDLVGTVTLEGNEFRTGIKAAEKICDHVSLGLEGENFFIEGKAETEHTKLSLPKSKLINIKPAKVRSLYSLDYLSDMSKVIGKAPEVTIELGNDYPARISFPVADGRGQIEYLLAPRIESE
jgi:proliferating cell nuclear antigen